MAKENLRILLVIGTRPEAVKLAPLLLAFKKTRGIEAGLCLTGQHQAPVATALAQFGIDCVAGPPEPCQDIALTGRLADYCRRVEASLKAADADLVIVQGDTLSALAGALTAFYRHIPVLHIEAGLRSGDRLSPWPEEMHRRMIASLASHHAAPTEAALSALAREGIDPAAILLSGNTGIDALMLLDARLRLEPDFRRRIGRELPRFRRGRKIIYVTCHRREDRAARVAMLIDCLPRLAARNDVEICLPLPNDPALRHLLTTGLSGREALHLTPPLSPAASVLLQQKSHLLLTDSGGLQEEASTLGRPVLILRRETERMETVRAGGAALVGCDPAMLMRESVDLLENRARHRIMAAPRRLFGDGRASARIRALVLAIAAGKGKAASLQIQRLEAVGDALGRLAVGDGAAE